MKFRDNELLKKISGRQQYLLAGIILAAVAALFFFGPDSGKSKNTTYNTDQSDITRTVMDLTRGSRAEKSWLHTAEDEFDGIKDRLEQLEKDRDRLLKANEKLTQTNLALSEESEVNKRDALVAIDAQAMEIARLTASAEQRDKANSLPSVAPVAANTFPTSPFRRNEEGQNPLAAKVRRTGDFNSQSETSLPKLVPSARLINFSLDTPVSPYKKLSGYVPAGSYAPAVVISGVDAGVGVEVQSNPRPVLFRITGAAISASLKGEEQAADISGCLVTGAAIGDLSSEKVYVRLQTMTCSATPGEVFEAKVEGYMVGAGKAGVRGIVVSREGDLIQKAFIAGAISGIGQGIAQAVQPSASLLTGQIAQQPPITDILKGGAGKGVGSAGDKVADYLIKRAEQYQPVVVMQSGTRVELVFIRGVSIKPELIPQASANATAQNQPQKRIATP